MDLRPIGIKRFEALYYTSLLIGVIISAIMYESMLLQVSPLFIGIVQFFTFASLTLLIFFISRKRSKIAKWILVVQSGLGIFFYIPQLSQMLHTGAAGFLSIIQMILQCIGLYYLFTDEVKEWMNNRNIKEPNEYLQNFSEANIDYSEYEMPTRFVSAETLATKVNPQGSAITAKTIATQEGNSYILCPKCATKLEKKEGLKILCGTCGYKGNGINVPSEYKSDVRYKTTIKPQIDSFDFNEKFNKVDGEVKLIKCPICANTFNGVAEANPPCPYCKVPFHQI